METGRTKRRIWSFRSIEQRMPSESIILVRSPTFFCTPATCQCARHREIRYVRAARRHSPVRQGHGTVLYEASMEKQLAKDEKDRLPRQGARLSRWKAR